ncbi:MAG: energy transducer TonB [Candidatus Korobacteraceae bacterium]
MFSELTPSGRKRWDLSLLGSFAAHVVVLLVLTHHFGSGLDIPHDVALGAPNSSGSGVIYLAPVGFERAKQPPSPKPELDLHASALRTPVPKRPAPDVREDVQGSETSKLDQTAHGGSPYGMRIPGAPLTGDEIVPALPQVFPDPAVSRADLPPGVQGDVTVEVTIDEQGNVVALKLIHGIGYGIEDRVLATLRQWHFRPASKDGVTIASQHIVTFHYPS